MSNLIESLQAAPREDLPRLEPGDSVKVSYRIVEGDRERVQEFRGTIIRVQGSEPNSKNFTVRRIASHGIGVERTFLIASPRLEGVEVSRKARVRRANLYYLRGRTGKAARLKERGRR
jgi:large subunit ribosomal protein L19